MGISHNAAVLLQFITEFFWLIVVIFCSLHCYLMPFPTMSMEICLSLYFFSLHAHFANIGIAQCSSARLIVAWFFGRLLFLLASLGRAASGLVCCFLLDWCVPSFKQTMEWGSFFGTNITDIFLPR